MRTVSLSDAETGWATKATSLRAHVLSRSSSLHPPSLTVSSLPSSSSLEAVSFELVRVCPGRRRPRAIGVHSHPISPPQDS